MSENAVKPAFFFLPKSCYPKKLFRVAHPRFITLYMHGYGSCTTSNIVVLLLVLSPNFDYKLVDDFLLLIIPLFDFVARGPLRSPQTK